MINLHLIPQELGKDVVANARRAEGVQEETLLRQFVLEFHIQNTYMSHSCSHRMTDDIQISLWMQFQQLAHRFCDVWLQCTAVVGDEEAYK